MAGHFMGEKLSLREGKKLVQGNRNSEKCEPTFLWLQILCFPFSLSPPIKTGKLKWQNSGFHDIYSLASFIHRSSPLRTCTAQTADSITFLLMIYYIYQGPAGRM